MSAGRTIVEAWKKLMSEGWAPSEPMVCDLAMTELIYLIDGEQRRVREAIRASEVEPLRALLAEVEANSGVAPKDTLQRIRDLLYPGERRCLLCEAVLPTDDAVQACGRCIAGLQ